MSAPPLYLGMGGRVGRLIRPFLPPATLTAARQGAERADLVWDLAAGSGPLRDLVARRGLPGALVVLAGVTPATGPDMAANVALARAAMAAARDVGVKRVLLASTAAVYGPGDGCTPWSEAAVPAPANAYAASKLAMEREAERFREAGLAVCALRIGNVAGADALLLNAPGPVVLDRFADGGGPVRSYIGPATLARVLAALCAPGLALPPVLNLAAPGPVAMRDLARAAGFRWSWTPAPATARQWQVMDCSALAGLVGFDDKDSAPATMVAEWRAAQGPR